MKKFFIILIAVTALTGCAKNETSTNNNISEIQQETLQPDPYSITTTTIARAKSEIVTRTTQKINTPNPKNTEDTVTITTTLLEIPETTTETTATTTAEIIPEDAQPDPLGAGAFSYDEDGAVQFVQEPEMDNQQLLISAGQALFESACQIQWKFTVGCPYNLDMESTIQNGFGWTYYKITDENIHSLADIENDYYKVFSERYPNEDLKMLYLEFEGNVYAMNGQREMNIYYSMSRITGIESQTDDEIFFTVENNYEGNDKNPNTPYSENETFSMVLAGNKIRVGQFRLPY
ncbi:MAG: hypothetical protein K2J32_05450 [Ruminococcus sp.]|nr:hypothetical protein [Ruminococcus sp.]